MYYIDATGLEHESYEAACHYYGADTPAQVAAEEAYHAELEAEEREAALDRCNEFDLFIGWPCEAGYIVNDEIPF